jgi:hypothetical protein
MFTDIVFSLASDTKIGSLSLKPGTYKLLKRSNQLVVWDSLNTFITSIPNQSVFDQLVLNQSVKITETICAQKYSFAKDQVFHFPRGQGWHAGTLPELVNKDSTLHIIEQNAEQYYIFEKDECLYKWYINKLIEDGTLVPQK